MKLPINIHLDFEGDEEEIFMDWMDENRAVLMNAMYESCWQFANDSKLDEILLMNFIDANEARLGEYVFQLSVTPDDTEKNLDECENFFVETEEYEKAIGIKKCREMIESNKKKRNA